MDEQISVLDLFSGIGGFTLGLASAGPFRTVAFCECEPFPRAVLGARWPGVPIYPDVRTLTAAQLAADGVVRPDLVCGGFPCQDISSAGKGAGINGLRSGLWREMARIIGEVRPRWVVVENSPALRSRGADRVLSDLESLGYAAWPAVVGAVHAGAWHRRQRVWIVAYADGVREHEPAAGGHHERLWAADVGQLADAHDRGWEAREHHVLPRQSDAPRSVAGESTANANRQRGDSRAEAAGQQARSSSGTFDCRETAADADSPELRQPQQWMSRRRSVGIRDQGITVAGDDGAQWDNADADRERRDERRRTRDIGGGRAEFTDLCEERGRPAQSRLVRVLYEFSDRLDRSAGLEAAEGFDWHPLSEEPGIPRTARNVPNRVERIAGLGNAVLPAVVAMIGRSILAVEAQL